MNPLQTQAPSMSLGSPQSSVSPLTATSAPMKAPSTPQMSMIPSPSLPQQNAQPKIAPISSPVSNPVAQQGFGVSDVMNNLANFGYQAPSKIDPQNLNVPVSTSITSNNLGKTSPGALKDAWDAKQLALRNGTDTSLIPSDDYYSNSIQGNLYNQVGNLSQYSPDEQNALQAKALNDAKIYNTQLAARRQIKQLQEDGTITKEQGAAFISEAQRRADAQSADQAGLGSYLTSSLDVLGKIRGNQLTAAQNQYGMLQPTQVTPGSTLYNPITGVQYQGSGAAPAQIASTAQQLEQSAIQTGNMATLPNGTIDHNYYLQQAQQFYQSGQYGTGQGMNQGGYNPSQGSNQSQYPGIDQSNQQYIDHSSDGVAYVDQGRLQNMTPYQKQVASQQFANAGIRVMDSNDVQALATIDSAKQNLALFSKAADNLLSSGLMGRIAGFTTNQLAQLAQINPEWRQFQTLRSGLIKAVQGVAAGAPGLRVTGAELGAAADSLPNSADNAESAAQSIKTFSDLLNVNRNVLLRGSAPSNSQGTGVTNSQGQVTSANF